VSRSRSVIAIDGPAGAGKSTVARTLAQQLGYILVDTGALYRGVALVARERGISWDDAKALGSMAQDLSLRFTQQPGTAPRLWIDGADRSDELRSPEISMGASQVSKHQPVRTALLGLQRGLGVDGGVVLEGRDIGTVVFPDAETKIFLTASAHTRARRRVAELKARGVDAELATTLAEIEARDAQDASRAIAPLKPAADAIIVDTDSMSIQQVVDQLVVMARERGA